jgi:predicted nucleic acid-binding Zn finger protein
MSLIEYQAILEKYFQSVEAPRVTMQKYIQVLHTKWNKIQTLITDEKIFKYIFLPSGLQFWVIMGKTDEYFILPLNFCSCSDFNFNVLIKKKEICCYHIIAQTICQNLNHFTIIYKDDTWYLDYLEDFLDRGRK